METEYMKKHPLLIMAFLILILFVISCSQKSKAAANTGTLNEITRIEKLSISDENGNSNITPQDLVELKELLKEDKIGESYANELEWLVRNNESQHILHTTLYMREYIKTGVDVPCIPHELWHVSLFVRHGDMAYAKLQLKSIEENYDAWIKSLEKKRKNYPQFYNGSGEIEQMSKESIEKLKKNNYSNQTLDELDKIGAGALC